MRPAAGKGVPHCDRKVRHAGSRKQKHGLAGNLLWQLLPLVVLLTLTTPETVAAASDKQQAGEFYLMDLTASGYRLADSVSTRQHDGTWFIHFASFLEAIEFPIFRDQSVWSGWFRNEQNRFEWDTKAAEVRVRGGTRRSAPSAFIELDEGMFVSSASLGSWFDLTLSSDSRTLTIDIVSAEPLPVEARRARASAKSRYRPPANEAVAVPLRDQYRWATVPLVDLSSHYHVQGSESGRKDTAHASVTMGMDLLKHSMLYSGSTASQNEQRLTIERRASLRGGTLALGIDSYALGDVVDDRSNLVNGGGRGAGFSIKRRRTTSGSQGRVTISGEGPPGWEAELYRNRSLITFGSVSSDGLYVFAEQDVVYGENIFLVKLHGPQGQIREERHSFWGGGLDLEQGDYSFSLSHVDFTERFIGGQRLQGASLPSEETSDLHFARALTDSLQVGAGYTWAQLRSREADGVYNNSEYATLDGRLNVQSGLLLASFANQQDHGSAWSLNYLTGINGHQVAVSRQQYRDFESPFTIGRIAADVQNQLTLSGPLDLQGLHSYTLRLVQQERADGLSDIRLFNRLGASWGTMQFSNDLDFLQVSSGDTSIAGRLRATGRWKRLSLRGQLDYDPTNAEPLNRVTAMLRWNASRKTHYTVNASKGLKSSRAFHVDASITTAIANLDFTMSLSMSSEDFWAAGIALATRFGYEPKATAFASPASNVSHTGRAILNMFIDRNNDGMRDPDEDTVEWATYKGQTSKSAAGSVQFAGLPAHAPLRVESRDFSFGDPFLVVRGSAYELYTHPGSDVSADIPVVMTGDVEGQLRPVPGRNVKISGIEVVLMDADGERVATSRSEFDGYFGFTGIAAGQYQVVVDTSAKSVDVQMQSFSLNPDEGFVALAPMLIYRN